MASVSKRLATDETLMLLVDAVNNTETVKQAKAEIQAEGTAQVNNVKSTAEEMVKDINQVPKNTSDIAELNSNLSQLEKSEVAGGKNLLNNKSDSIPSRTGISAVVNDDKSITINGTATNHTYIGIYGSLILENGKTYKVIGCPSGGSAWKNTIDEGGTYNIYVNGYEVNPDIGNGSVITPSNTDSSFVIIWICKGYTCNNLVFKPMITTDLSLSYDDYEPYIPSVKMLAEEVSAQNDSLADYGLDNKCNSLEQGYATWWDANVEQSTDYIHTDFISVSNGDLITIKGGLNASHVIFYNASKEFISFETDVNKVSVPSGVAFVRANFHASGITPNNVNIGIYVENQIDVIKNDLGGLSFSVSGTTLSITNGTNTWTLTQ